MPLPQSPPLVPGAREQAKAEAVDGRRREREKAREGEEARGKRADW